MTNETSRSLGSADMWRLWDAVKQLHSDPEPLLAFEHPRIESGKDWTSLNVVPDRERAVLLVGADADVLAHSPLHLIVGEVAVANWITQGLFVALVPPRQSCRVSLWRTPAGDMLRGDAQNIYDPGFVTLWGFRVNMGPRLNQSAPDAPLSGSDAEVFFATGWSIVPGRDGAGHLARWTDMYTDEPPGIFALCHDGPLASATTAVVTCRACARDARRRLAHVSLAKGILF